MSHHAIRFKRAIYECCFCQLDHQFGKVLIIIAAEILITISVSTDIRSDLMSRIDE